MLTRRTFLPSAAITAARVLKAAPRARIENLEVISQQPEFYHGWPTLAMRRSGELLVACSGGREQHVCPFGRVELIRSSDSGRSWSWPEVLLDTPIDDRDSGVCETRAGSLLVTTFTSLAYEQVLERASGWPPERFARWQAVNRRATPRQREALLGTWMLRSTDGGMTWSAPYRVPVNSPHGPISLASGRLLYAGKRLWDPDHKVGVCESTDDGKTWRWLADIPARPGDSVVEYHELHAGEAANGRLLVHIRNHNHANSGETLQSESTDGGKTWSVPHPIGVWGLPSHLLRLRDGRLLMTYGYRRAPFGNQARISEDQGRAWSEPLILSDDGAGSDLGYPSTVELAGGRLVTVWYERMKDSPHAVLRKAVWSIAT
ncbi:MAG TPA: sialidase family protein [Bryobacteraceae bacterium]|nr:sialidase family protein [Bryobacteraceae bacterium]